MMIHMTNNILFHHIMEFLVFTGLAAASYVLNRIDEDKTKSNIINTRVHNNGNRVQHRQTISPSVAATYTNKDMLISSLQPSMKNMYESDFTKYTKLKELQHASVSLQEAEPAGYDKESPRVVLNSLRKAKPASPEDDVKFHNNMQPFFKGEAKQSNDEKLFTRMMETFTGNPKPGYVQKTEIQSMFEPIADMTFISGAPVNVDRYIERIQVKELKNNELPFDKVQVGRGIGVPGASHPTGGFHQFETQELLKPRTVDDLRTKNNPKVVYEGKVLSGKGPLTYAQVTHFEKRLPERTADISDRIMPSKSAVSKAGIKGDVDVKYTTRADSHVAYSGNPGDSKKGFLVGADTSPVKNKTITDETTLLNPAGYVPPVSDDYGYDSAIASYVETTGEALYDCPDESPLGIASSIVKAISAPIIDAIKVTKKDTTVQTYRERGNITIQFPHKATVHDPEGHIAKTTVKETTTTAADPANLSGPIMNVVRDPDNVARTTIKETLIHDTVAGPIKGPIQVIATYDPSQVARVTTRETTNDVHYPVMGNTFVKGKVMDPNVVMRTTIKETVTGKNIEANIRTLMGKPGAYFEDPTEAKSTNRQFTSLEEYVGIANRQNSDGYNGPNAPFANDGLNPTNRQTTSLESSMGPAQSEHTKQVSYDGLLGHRTSASRELALEGRDPTSTGPKTYLGIEANEEVTKTRQVLPKIEHEYPSIRNMNIHANLEHQPVATHMPLKIFNEKDEPRFLMDVSVLQQLSNPLVLPSFHQMAGA